MKPLPYADQYFLKIASEFLALREEVEDLGDRVREAEALRAAQQVKEASARSAGSAPSPTPPAQNGRP